MRALLTEATADEKAAYLEALQGVLEQSDKLEGQALDRVKALMAEMQERVLGRLRTLQDDHTIRKPDGTLSWDAFSVLRLRHAVEEVANEISHRYGDEVSAYLPKAFDLGADLIDAAAEAMGYAGPAPRINPVDIAIAANWKPDLVAGMSDFAKERLGNEIAVSVRTGESPFDLMTRLAKKITTDGTPFHSVAYRAELITRVESKRINDLGNTKRLQQYDQAYPDEIEVDLLVAEVNGYPCEQCSALAAQGPWKVADAPNIPDDTHPGCRCDKIPTFKGVPTPDPADKPTDAQRDASVAADTENDESDEAGEPTKESDEPHPARADSARNRDADYEEPRVIPTVDPHEGDRLLRHTTEVSGTKGKVSWDPASLLAEKGHLIKDHDAAEVDDRLERVPWLLSMLEKPQDFVSALRHGVKTDLYTSQFQNHEDDDAENLVAFATDRGDGTMELKTWFTPTTKQLKQYFKEFKKAPKPPKADAEDNADSE